MNEVIAKAKEIKCLITDVDGVMTEGFLFLNDEGKEYKSFHVQDGLGLKLLMSAGIQTAVITTSSTALIDHRMRQLGIEIYHKGQRDKRLAYQNIKSQLGVEDHQCAYVGDDLPDLAILKQVGFAVTVANAVSEVKAVADWQTQNCGGRGALREVCDLILKAQGKHEQALEEFLKL